MKNLNKTGSLVLILFIFCAIGAFVLAGLNEITAPKILEIEIEKTKNALKKVAPKATDFTALEYDTEANPNILEAYVTKESTENTGYCTLVSTQGFGGEIKLMVGVTNDGSVIGVSIVSMAETPGLGTKADNEEWLGQFILKKSPITVVKNKAQNENDVVAVSGATVTSEAVKKGVEAAIAFVGGLGNE